MLFLHSLTKPSYNCFPLFPVFVLWLTTWLLIFIFRIRIGFISSKRWPWPEAVYNEFQYFQWCNPLFIRPFGLWILMLSVFHVLFLLGWNPIWDTDGSLQRTLNYVACFVSGWTTTLQRCPTPVGPSTFVVALSVNGTITTVSAYIGALKPQGELSIFLAIGQNVPLSSVLLLRVWTSDVNQLSHLTSILHHAQRLISSLLSLPCCFGQIFKSPALLSSTQHFV